MWTGLTQNNVLTFRKSMFIITISHEFFQTYFFFLLLLLLSLLCLYFCWSISFFFLYFYFSSSFFLKAYGVEMNANNLKNKSINKPCGPMTRWRPNKTRLRWPVTGLGMALGPADPTHQDPLAGGSGMVIQFFGRPGPWAPWGPGLTRLRWW